MARSVLVTSGLILVAMLSLLAQADTGRLRSRLEARFVVLPLAGGVVLTPRFETTVRSIEVSGATIAIDGAPVTGAELRERLGEDADAVLQVSYLEPEARRTLALPDTAASPATSTPAAPPAPPIDRQEDGARDGERQSRRRDLVRVGGSVEVRTGEHVTGDVVAIGGSARIDGRVDGDVVVVGGSAHLGPNAEISRDVTVVGGGLSRHDAAIIRGGVHEVGIGSIPFDAMGWRPGRWNPLDGLMPVARFMGTVARMGLLMLLAGLVVLIASRPVERIAERATSEPLKSWVVGFLIQILFVPALVLSIVVLAVSIIGIPLLLLVPFALVASLVVCLVGFTGVAYGVGRLIEERVEMLRGKPYLATFAGILAILSPLLLARLLYITGGWFGGIGVVAGLLVLSGVVAEYLAWTTGLGAAVLARFGGPPVATLPLPSPPPAATP